MSKAQCDAAGLDKHAVARLVRKGAWKRVARCVYDTDPVPVEQRRRVDYHDHVRRRAAWIAMLAVPDGIATGACALALYGVAGLPAKLVPEAARPQGKDVAVTGGVVLRRYAAFPVERYRGRWIAGFVHALAQALPNLTRDEAVAVLSNALHEGHIDEGGLRRVRELVRGRRGAAQVHDWFGLVEARDASPAETATRLSCIEHDVPPDGQQITFTSGGVFLGRVDFVWSLADGRYLVVEIDGRAFHSGAAMLADDSLRQNGLVGTDRLIILRFPATQSLANGGVGREIAERLAALSWMGAPVAETVELGSAPVAERRAGSETRPR
ncbi:hypothetical protein [Promicromonospora iranensis]|uniref:hypothetical protein n=1 Tax=Promicromonospora iranensis TaxID=1105144 RepID=UPI0023A9201A|nr:hypothetical protein [Promicromonospora iranensis]